LIFDLLDAEVNETLANARRRIPRVGISYDGVPDEEGKKITMKDGVHAIHANSKDNFFAA
jgi:hypothetical protein